MRVPQEFKGIEDAELVLKFKGPEEIGEYSSAKKISALPIVAAPPPELGMIMMAAQQFEQKKDYAKLSLLLEGVLDKYPDEPMVLNAYAWMLATAEDKKFIDAEKAVKLARKAVELTKEENGAILDTLAVALHLQGNLKEAVKYIKMAAEKCPDETEIIERAQKYEAELNKK